MNVKDSLSRSQFRDAFMENWTSFTL